jgi:predicted TPR repeat methyltransferase
MRTQDLIYGREYWDTYDDGAGYFDGPVWEDTAHIVKELFGYDAQGQDQSNGKRLIDIGCANGFLVHQVRRRGIESFGLDVSRYAIAHASKHVRGNVNLWDFAQSNTGPFYGWRSFNFVTCLETLEHIHEIRTDLALDNLRNLMVPEGGLGFFTICVEENPGWESDPTHINIHPRDWWTEKLLEHGFIIDYSAIDWVRSFCMYSGHEGVFVVSGVSDPEPVEDVVESDS